MSNPVKGWFDRYPKNTSLALTLLLASAIVVFMRRALFDRSVDESLLNFRAKLNIKYNSHV